MSLLPCLSWKYRHAWCCERKACTEWLLWVQLKQTKDCESWWLPSGHSSVVSEYWQLKPWVLGLIPIQYSIKHVLSTCLWNFASYNTVSNMYWVHVCEILHCKGQFGTFVTLTWYTDVDSRQLVDAWLVCSISQEPGVSRAFQITLPVGGNTPTQKVAIEHFSSWVSIYSHGRKTENGDLGLTWYGKGCYECVIVNCQVP